MYQPVDKFPNFPTLEKRILNFWEEIKAFDKLRDQNKKKPIWSFLDGPITANNPMGVHHAWGRSLKDMYQRYHAMCGQRLRYQNGFDCQGLWVEVEVEKEHGFKSKRDIEEYGIAKFVEECKERVEKYSKIQTDQSVRLGYWMDWNDSYFTMSEENNYTIWHFLKLCFDRGFIYRGFDSMPWCPRCGVGLSQMEMHEGYKWVEHLSVFVRFPLRNRKKEALLVWTTTPWTLTSNVAAAVHPDMTYLKLQQGDWIYYVGEENFKALRSVEVEEEIARGKRRKPRKLKSISDHMKSEGSISEVGTLKGKEMIGWEYDGPFDELPAQNEKGGYPNPDPKLMDQTGVSCHQIIAWDQVIGSEGTGIVHIAPGCGKEDFILGQEKGLVAISPLTEAGIFLERFDWLSDRSAHDVSNDVALNLDKKGILIAKEQYPHRYAHCWRCATPVLYRMVDEWFINMDWRDEIMETVSKVRWIPDYGKQLELDWLKNMGNWMISKKRYWGLALPIWVCESQKDSDPKKRCDWFTVIGSKAELKEKAIAGWEDFEGHSPHRPWVDQVKIRCEKCNQEAKRIPDVGNPWLDAGIVPYSTMSWKDPKIFNNWFPADLVLESFPGQFRNWFYALLALNTMMQQERWTDGGRKKSQVVPPFKTLLGHALVRDEEGREMHKSLGNSVEFNTAADTIGAEVMRYMYAAQNPTSNLNFPDISESRKKNTVHSDQEIYRKLLTFWNCYSFYVTYASVDEITPDKLQIPIEQRSQLDRWILSKFQHLVQFARDSFADYRLHSFMERYERFIDNLSNWYIRRSRRRFWKSENDIDKLAAYATLFEVLEGICRVTAPILPFLAEEVYQNIVRGVDPKSSQSVHLSSFPECNPELVNTEIESQIDTVIRYKNLGLSLRNQENIKVRQPLSRILIKAETAKETEALSNDNLVAQILQEINVKSLEILQSEEGLVELLVRPNFKVLGKKHGKYLKEIQAQLEGLDPKEVRSGVRGGGGFTISTSSAGNIVLIEEDLLFKEIGTRGLAVISDRGAFVALDTNITPELKRESMARDFVRAVQIQRKDLDLHVADRIRLSYSTNQEMAAAIKEWADYICKETLAVELIPDATIDQKESKKTKIAGHEVLSSILVIKK